MSRIIKSKDKESRKRGISIDGREIKRNTIPGQHGMSGLRRSSSDYARQLGDAKIFRHFYYMTGSQMRIYLKKSQKMQGNVADNLTRMLESRLATVVYRAGFAKTIFSARQLVSHGHFLINGKKANIPSIILQDGDIITLKDSSKNLSIISDSIAMVFGSDEKKSRSVPSNLIIDQENRKITVDRLPTSASDVTYPFPTGNLGRGSISGVIGYYS
jgi:small subunit ribosomal protein S4